MNPGCSVGPTLIGKTMRLTVHAPKTEHHEGHETREVPIFPELVEPLRDADAVAETGEPHVLPMLQERTSASLRKPILQAIEKAGSKPWAKLWTALRATRDTELREDFPAHVVTSWIGHDDSVAQRHYLQVTDDHFARAAKARTKSGAQVAQIAAQNQAAGFRRESQESSQVVDACDSMQKETAARENVPLHQVGVTGLEPVTSAV